MSEASSPPPGPPAALAFLSGDGLSQRTARASLWAFAARGGVQLIGLARSIILARLLLPADFGLMGLASVATGFLAVMTETGINKAVIYRQEVDEDVLSTAWLIGLVRGAVLASLTFALAGQVARFFEAPDLTAVLRALSLVFLLHGASSIGLVLFSKELDFRRLARLQLIAGLVSIVVAVVTALLVRNVWALVMGTLAGMTVTFAGSYVMHPFRPRLKWRGDAAREMLHYSKFVFGGGVVNYFLTEGDDAFVGKVLGIGPLGFYRMAYRFSNLPATSITEVVSSVAFSTYAKLQDDIPSLREAYFRILKLTSLLVVPAIGGLFVLAPEMVRVLYGEKWMPMVPALMILCAYGLERAVNASVAPLFNAVGRPKVVFYLTSFKLVLLVVLIVPLTLRYGIVGTSVASSITAIVISLNAMPLVARTLECRTMAIWRLLTGPFLASGVMMAAVYAFKSGGWFSLGLGSLLAAVFVGVAAYAMVAYTVDETARDWARHLLAAMRWGGGQLLGRRGRGLVERPLSRLRRTRDWLRLNAVHFKRRHEYLPLADGRRTVLVVPVEPEHPFYLSWRRGIEDNGWNVAMIPRGDGRELLDQVFVFLWACPRVDVIHLIDLNLYRLAGEYSALDRLVSRLAVRVFLIWPRVLGKRVVYSFGNEVPHEFDTPAERRRHAYICRAVDDVIGHSPAMAANVARLGVSETRVWPVEHADISEFFQVPADRPGMRQAYGFGDDDIVLLSIGSIRPYKGIELAVEAFKRATDPRLRLVVAGGLTGAYSEAGLRGLTADDPRIALGPLRFLDWGEMAWLFDGADYCVLSYRAIGHSGLICQALGLGVPVIGARVGCIPDYLASGAGLLFEPGDADDLARVLDGLGDFDRERARAVGLAVMRQRSPERIGERLVRLYAYRRGGPEPESEWLF